MRNTNDELDGLLEQPASEDAALSAFLEKARSDLSAPPSDIRRQWHLSAIHATARRQAEPQGLSWLERARTVFGLATAKVALAGAVAVAATGTVATGSLPDPIQNAIADAGEAVGVQVPRSGDVIAAPPEDEPTMPSPTPQQTSPEPQPTQPGEGVLAAPPTPTEGLEQPTEAETATEQPTGATEQPTGATEQPTGATEEPTGEPGARPTEPGTPRPTGSPSPDRTAQRGQTPGQAPRSEAPSQRPGNGLSPAPSPGPGQQGGGLLGADVSTPDLDNFIFGPFQGILNGGS